MPWSLKRYQSTGDFHFLTFSCYKRQPFFSTPDACTTFLQSLESARRRFQFYVFGYVIMPEHVHLLLSEPEHQTLAYVLQVVKQMTARKLALSREPGPFWYTRYYDFNVWNDAKRVEKLRYMHRNPVTRGLVDSPEKWPWSSFTHFLTGDKGVVEVESEWTFKERERRGEPPRLKRTTPPSAKEAEDGAPANLLPD